MSVMLCTEFAILGGGCGGLGALEKHLPGVFIRRVEEPAQSLVPRRVELPQVESPSLTREDQADEHYRAYVDKLELLVHHVFNTCLESGQLFRITLGQALLFPGGEPRGDSGSKLGGHHPVGVARLGDVEPPRLPPLYGLHIGAFELGDVRHFAPHGASALRLLADHNLRLHVEDLQPQAEVGPDA